MSKMLLNLEKEGEKINLYLEITCLPARATHTNQLISHERRASVFRGPFSEWVCVRVSLMI